MQVVAPNQPRRTRIGTVALGLAAATAIGAAVVAFAASGEDRFSGLLVLLGWTAGLAWVGRSHLRRSPFSVLVSDESITITEITGATHTWRTVDVGLVHHYWRVQGKHRSMWMAVRDPEGGLLVDLFVEPTVDVEELAAATASVGIYTTRQPGVPVDVVSHSPAGRPDITAVSSSRSRWLVRFLVLAVVPCLVLMVPGALLLGAGHDIGVVLVLAGLGVLLAGVAYLFRHATGLTFSAAGVHPGVGVTLAHAIERDRIRTLRVHETWIGTAVQVELDDGQVATLHRQVGLTADEVRLAAMTVGIPRGDLMPDRLERPAAGS